MTLTLFSPISDCSQDTHLTYMCMPAHKSSVHVCI
uniref:Uncharacterized protein n=1 Tax=Rhizophora mucronata TaxID=61149 RepID=A0A2P2Q1F7_RHIMU